MTDEDFKNEDGEEEEKFYETDNWWKIDNKSIDWNLSQKLYIL